MHDRYVASILSTLETRIRRLEWGELGPSAFDQDNLERRIVRMIMESIMPTLQETLDAVTKSGDRLDSLITLFEQTRQRVAEVTAASGISAEDQAKIDAIFAEAQENSDKIDRALNVNVPPATPVDTPANPIPEVAPVDAPVDAAPAEPTPEQPPQ